MRNIAKNPKATKKMDLRFNEIKDAITEISHAVNNIALNDEAIAALVVAFGRGINKPQVMTVLERLRALESKYVKKSKNDKGA